MNIFAASAVHAQWLELCRRCNEGVDEKMFRILSQNYTRAYKKLGWQGQGELAALIAADE